MLKYYTYLNALIHYCYYYSINSLTHTIVNDIYAMSRSRSKYSERTNRHRGKAINNNKLRYMRVYR